MSHAPEPLDSQQLAPFLERLAAGEDFKIVLEDLLLALPVDVSEHLGLLLREGRGSWIPLLHSSSGRALFIGSAFSGTVHVLAALGFRPHLYDVSEERMRFESFRCEALTGVRCSWTVAGDVPRLPFETDEFQVVVQESGTPAHPSGWAHDYSELARVARGEVVLTANNRLAYKRSRNRRGRFALSTPLGMLREIVASPSQERTLRGYRRALEFEGWGEPRAFSIYPHATDFTHVVALDEEAPRLHVGPKERKNKLKVLGHRIGLFPVLTPSFALFACEAELKRRSSTRIQGILAELSEQSGEEMPVLDEWIASRGNCIVLQTRAANGDLAKEEGRWCLHIALSPHKGAQVELHHRVIEQLWERGQPVPVPEPIFFGQIDGVTLSCERRLGGLTAPQRSGDQACMRLLLEDTVQHLQQLVVREARPIDDKAFDQHFRWRFEIVAEHAGRAETRDNIEALCETTRERVLGHAMPLVLQHADLRNKHVQIEPSGHVLGFLDWGSSRERDVPYFDLLQLIIHEHKQARGGRVGHAWQNLLEGQVSTWERAALDSYCNAIGLAPEVARAIEAAFPIFVAAMAESNWDYSRPRWMHRSFGL